MTKISFQVLCLILFNLDAKREKDTCKNFTKFQNIDIKLIGVFLNVQGEPKNECLKNRVFKVAIFVNKELKSLYFSVNHLNGAFIT